MKKLLKKVVEVILTSTLCLSFILMCAEKADGSICILWNFGWLAVFGLSAYFLNKIKGEENECHQD